MPDYNKGKIYGLYYSNELIYVGSTTCNLNYRFCRHVNNAKKNNKNIYYFINNCDLELLDIKLIENYPCVNKYELLKREGFYIKKYYNSILNVNIAKGHKSCDERVKCDCGFELRSDSMYDHIKSKQHNIFLNNPNELIKYYERLENPIPKVGKMYIRIECSCGGSFQKKSKSRHLKSKLHLKSL